MSTLVDALQPPDFTPNGSIKTIEQVVKDGDWLGGLHLWLYMRTPVPSVVCQLRGANSLVAPNKLDVTAGGHYEPGEQGLDGIRELQEELGLDVPRQLFDYWGRRLFITVDESHRRRNYAMDIYTAEYAVSLSDLHPRPDEVAGVFVVPLVPLLKVLLGGQESLAVKGKDASGNPLEYVVTKDAFYHNPDNYHLHLLEHIAFKLGVKI